jgi:hypothetical protein
MPIPKDDDLVPENMFLEHPLGIRSYLLRQFSLVLGKMEIDYLMKRSKRKPEVESLPFYEQAQKIDNLLYSMVVDGQSAENVGNEHAAICFYEELIRQQFPGSFPYRRLRIIYTKNKKPDDAIRACKAYLEMEEAEFKVRDVFEQISTKPKIREKGKKELEFEEWITKIEAKKKLSAA